MTATTLRVKVLEAYRSLLQTCKTTFGNDLDSCSKVVTGVRQEFRKNKEESDPNKILEMIEAAKQTERFIKSGIVQARLDTDSGAYKLKIPKEMPSNSVIEPINKIKIK